MPNKKYRINQLLDSLPYKHKSQIVEVLPGLLGVSAPTFNNYRRINKDDSQDIPHCIVVKLEKFFGISAGALANYEVKIASVNEYLVEETALTA